jgi:outer membrane protein TolC
MKAGCGLIAIAAALAGCAHFDPQPIVPAQTAAAWTARSLSDADMLRFVRDHGVAPPEPGQPWGVDALTLAALYYQPALAEARAHLETVRAAEKTAAQRPNPTLTATGAYDNQIPGNPTPWSLVPLSIDLPFETAGKRRYRRDEARHASEAERWTLQGAVWQERARVRAAVVGLIVARRRQTFLAAQEAAQQLSVRLLEGQLRAGNVAGYDVTQARIALASARFAAQDGAAATSDALSELAAAIGLPRQALEGVPLAESDLTSLPPAPDPAALRRAALLERSDVRAALAQYAAAQSALQLEVANQYPDVHLGPGYQFNSGSAGDSMWQLSLTATLPLFNQNQGPIAEARRRRAEAAAHFLSVQGQALNDVESALARYEAARRAAAAAEALTAQLDRRRQSIRDLARAGETDPLATAAADVEYDSAALARLDVLLRAAQARGELEAASERILSP